MPPQQTAIGILSTAIQNLERNQFPAEITGATGKLFEYLGPEMPLTERMVFANLWLFGWLVERQLVASSLTNALVRTTTAATMFESGVKENVLPTKAKAVINFRILPGESVQSVIDHVRKTIGDARVKITPVKKVLSEPSAVSVPESSSFENLHRTIRQIFPDAIVAPWLVVGATDSRHYAKLSGNIYRFVPIRMDPGDTRRFHGTDERISVDNYENCVRFFMQLIRNSHS
jgi:carboxypeptidase PM20D1